MDEPLLLRGARRILQVAAVVLLAYSAVTGNALGIAIGLVGLSSELAITAWGDRSRRRHEEVMRQLREEHDAHLARLDPDELERYEQFVAEFMRELEPPRRRWWRR